jgi:hypothetical protein
MKETPEPPVPTPDKTSWEKFTALARRVIAVPKSEIPTKPKPPKRRGKTP